MTDAVERPAAEAVLIDQHYSINSSSFRYVRREIRRDAATGGQLVTHEIEVHGPQSQRYTFFAHYRNHGLPSLYGFHVDTPADFVEIDTTEWKAGERRILRRQIRLPAGTYSVSIGFYIPGTNRRLTLPEFPGDVMPVGSVQIDIGAQDLLRPSGSLLPAHPSRLLEEVLAMPAIPGAARDHLTLCFGQAPQFGHVLEFGVASGATVNHLAALAPHRQIFGFDTFSGLPEPWVRSAKETVSAGTFSVGGKLPDVRPNVKLIQGLFHDTLPQWLAENPGCVSFVHVDADLYSAAKYVLEKLNDRIVPSTVIVFDDVAIWQALKEGQTGGYDNWREGEWRAILEWAEDYRRNFALISRLQRSVLGVRVLV